MHTQKTRVTLTFDLDIQ